MERKWTVGWDREQATDLLRGSIEHVSVRLQRLGISEEDTKNYLSDILKEAQELKDSLEPWNDMDVELGEKWPRYWMEWHLIATAADLRALLVSKGFSSVWIERYADGLKRSGQGVVEYRRRHEAQPLGDDELDWHGAIVSHMYR